MEMEMEELDQVPSILEETMASNKGFRAGQFTGCLVGGLIGDCLGFTFASQLDENDGDSIPEAAKYFSSLVKKMSNNDAIDFEQYTANTSMTIALMNVILKSSQFDSVQLATEFTRVYFHDRKNRFHSRRIRRILSLLSKNKFKDHFQPAQDLGGVEEGGSSIKSMTDEPTVVATSNVKDAMTWTSPLALVSAQCASTRNLVQLTIAACRITHAHVRDVVGAVFQALFIRVALLHGRNSTSEKLRNAFAILDSCQKTFQEVSKKDLGFAPLDEVKECLLFYTKKFDSIRTLLMDETMREMTEVQQILSIPHSATGTTAVRALYCFLASFSKLSAHTLNNEQYINTLTLAVQMDENAASVAGATAGAYLGIWPDTLSRQCEDYPVILNQGKKLFKKMKSITHSYFQYLFELRCSLSDVASSPATDVSHNTTELTPISKDVPLLDLNMAITSITSMTQNSTVVTTIAKNLERTLRSAVTIYTCAESAIRHVKFIGKDQSEQHRQFLDNLLKNLVAAKENQVDLIEDHLLDGVLSDLRHVTDRGNYESETPMELVVPGRPSLM